jgi:uncharacterized membrane protein YqiK
MFLEGLSQVSMVVLIGVGLLVFVLFSFLIALSKFYKKVDQGKVLVRNGVGGPVISFGGIWVVPIIHKFQIMDISVKRIQTDRRGVDGLICKDNIRADIRVCFFVRVNQTNEHVLKVAQSLGCDKASDQPTLEAFFDAKFSEALKTVGKKFDFVQLYTERNKFKEEILQVIGTDLNGYVLDDAAIDYLEQTSLDHHNPQNILDAEGIKKITEITARELIKANQIQRDKEKTIEQQNVEAREAILELQKQQAEAEEKQKREISTIKAREEAESAKVGQEEFLKSERARIITEEEVAIATENKDREVIVAQKAKERTTAVETERVDKDRLLEQTEKEKIVALAKIAKEKAIEEEHKNIQTVIRERVMVEKEVVIEQERIKDTQAFAEAQRTKQVAITLAQQEAEKLLIKEVSEAEASKKASQHLCEQQIIEADAKLKASEKEADARKTLADAKATEEAVVGISQARVMEAKAKAIELEGNANAKVIELTANSEAMSVEVRAVAEAKGIEVKAVAEAKGVEANAVALEKQGVAEASVMEKKYSAEAKGIREKADSMKMLDGIGKDHEEFKLRLDKEKSIDLARINIQKDIADSQAGVIQEALRSAKIEIVGGETMFFDKIIGSITAGKSVDHMVESSDVLGDIKSTFFNGEPDYFKNQIKNFLTQFSMSSEDVKNLSVSALIGKMLSQADGDSRNTLQKLLGVVEKVGIGGKSAHKYLS